MKKISVRILALFLVLLMTLPMVIACGETPEETKGEEGTKAPAETNAPSETEGENKETESETESETEYVELPVDYLEELDFTGTTITFLAWDDYTMQEFSGTGDKGEEIDSALYRRNTTVEDKLGVTLEFLWQAASASDERNAFIDRVAAD
jgi:hypothetical protein